MNIDRALTPDEKLRRAEEIYYRRKGTYARQNNKTVSVPVSNQRYLVKRMIIQIAICFIIYCSYYVIKNFNFIFSKDIIDKTNEVLSYDINIQDIYCKIANYINNYSYDNRKNEESENNSIENDVKGEELQNNNEVIEKPQATEEKAVSDAETNNEIAQNNVDQMQLDANEIKEKYSIINPLQGQITSRFGAREQTEEVVSPYHVGLDIAANTGTAIVASMEGKVAYSGDLDGYGKCVQIQKDDVLTIYGHCSQLYVNVGDNICQGQKIAEVGQTGNATGPHLHFEIRKSNRYVDPELIL